MTPDLNKLRKLAEAATPGLRRYEADAGRNHPELVRWGDISDGNSGFAEFSYGNHTAEAKFFAAMTRETLLALLERIQEPKAFPGLDTLEALRKAGTQGELEKVKPTKRGAGSDPVIVGASPYRIVKVHPDGYQEYFAQAEGSRENAALIIAAVNALQPLIDRVRGLEAAAVPPYIKCEMCGESDCCDGKWSSGYERPCLHCGRVGELTEFIHHTGHTFWVLTAIYDEDDQL